jgi:NAD(P)-dependent dehydrogenase (short-subunit alcohol dehydrogenase family)
MATATAASHWTPDAIPDQSGRTALITGAGSGIGLETARVLAQHGARVILAGRSQPQLDGAVATVRATAPQAQLDTLLVDLADLASIRAAAARISTAETLDLLINNAGVMNLPRRQTTKDGFELTFGTNHLGHFAFDAGVWPAVQRAAGARVVTVSAIAATWRSGRLGDLMSERRYRPMDAYAKSKRANVVYTLELARRLADQPIAAIVVHPGSAMTNLQRHSKGALTHLGMRAVERLAMGSLAGAAWPTLYAATSADAHSGEFIGPAGRDQTGGTPRPVGLPRGAGDPAEGEWLWGESERLTELGFDPATRAG